MYILFLWGWWCLCVHFSTCTEAREQLCLFSSVFTWFQGLSSDHQACMGNTFTLQAPC